jgi:hypothetical protein
VQRYEGRFFGRRVNCELVPALPAWAVRRVLDDQRRIPYLMVWRSRDDDNVKEAVRVAHVIPTSYLPHADSVEVKRTDGNAVHVRVLKRPLPRGIGYQSLLACPVCCSPRRDLYAWAAGGKYTSSAFVAIWQCRRCAGLRYASEGGALVLRSRASFFKAIEAEFGSCRSQRPEPWYPQLYSSPAELDLWR